MNKNVIAVFAAACGLVLVSSCDTPKDLRPGAKVSVDTVPPGTRNTNNIEGVKDAHGHGTMHNEQHKVMPNHDAGVNSIEAGDSTHESGTTNTEAGAIRR